MQLCIHRGHEAQTDRKGRSKGVEYWFSYRLELSPNERRQIDEYLNEYHILYDAPALQISVGDLLGGKHTNRSTTFERVLMSEQAIRKAASRLVSELTAMTSYAGDSVVALTADEQVA